MNQVLDEIGIEVKGKMDSAPAAGSSSLAGKSMQSLIEGNKICSYVSDPLFGSIFYERTEHN